MLTTFDAPRFNTTCTRRIRSNTPLQSLTLSNDQTMIELARGFAQRVSQDSDGSLQGGLDLAFNVAFSRSPSQAEMERLVTYWHSVQQDFNRHPDAAAELLGVDEPTTPASDQAAWVALCRVLMNLDEFITKE
jgi:hypothetical protein